MTTTVTLKPRSRVDRKAKVIIEGHIPNPGEAIIAGENSKTMVIDFGSFAQTLRSTASGWESDVAETLDDPHPTASENYAAIESITFKRSPEG